MGFFSWLFRKTNKTRNTDHSTLVDIDTSALSVQNYFKHPEFIDFNRKHRDHQKDAILKSENQSIGQITLPTGTGKTRIQLAIHLENLIHKTNNNDIGVYVIVAHRLALCNQLISDFMYLVSVKLKIPCNFLSVSSDNFNKNRAIKTLKKRYHLKNLIIEESLKGCDFKSTTIQDEIKAFVEISQKQNRHVIIISTYDSFDRLKVLSNIDICTFDEAHTTTNDEFTSNINEVKSSLARQFFFTATRKVSGDTGGMNDEQFYGKVLHQISPKEMVEAGEIVIPNNYQIIKVSNDEGYNYDNPIMVVRTIVEGFKEHLQAVKKHSCSPEKIGAKLLVTCEGANQLEDVVKDTAFQLWAKEANIKVVSLSSYQEREGYIQVTDDKVAFVNKSRNELLEMIYDMNDEENAILLHVDILAEGIDLPCITGIMPLREMSVSKLQQTLGRATRLIQTDRMNLYQGKIKPSQYDKYVKPFAWVLLPEYLVENTQFIKNTIESLYRDYNVHPEHYSKGEQYLSDPKYDLPPLNTPEQINRKMHEGDLTHVFELSAFLNSLDLTQEALEKYIVDRFDDYDKKKNEIVENNS